MAANVTFAGGAVSVPPMPLVAAALLGIPTGLLLVAVGVASAVLAALVRAARRDGDARAAQRADTALAFAGFGSVVNLTVCVPILVTLLGLKAAYSGGG